MTEYEGIDPSLVVTVPKIVGGYRVTPNHEYGLVFFTFTKKPSWWHRMWCRLLLGWRWVDSGD